ncbi:hypothetical protein WN55_01525, partial [Dufourea novaeangliae]
PYCHALRLQVMPSLVHLVETSLQHNGVILTGQRAQQLSSCAVQGRVNVTVCFDFRLEVLQQKTNTNLRMSATRKHT